MLSICHHADQLSMDPRWREDDVFEIGGFGERCYFFSGYNSACT
jgi:hypothetical protein